MESDEKYMSRCLELARLGTRETSPNPMVGCVIVHDGKIIGEGYHERYGEAHAEVNALNSVVQPELLSDSTLYVSLEPCAHFGKTPPCSDLIVAKKIPKVVIGTIDPFAEVAGKGIEKLKKSGIEVRLGVIEKECQELNKRFFTFHEKHRPYIFLKWAQTEDGFIDMDRSDEHYGEPTWITGPEALLQVHRMRAAEDAIMVGTNTAEKDNPSLTVRLCEGRNPLRIVIDKNLRLSPGLKLFDNSAPTLVFNDRITDQNQNIEFIRINFSGLVIPQIILELYQREVQSLIVEGGQQLLQNFIDAGMWDEAHVFTGTKKFGKGVSAPTLNGTLAGVEKFGNDLLQVFRNPEAVRTF